MQDTAGLFQDRTAASGLVNLVWRGTGFGTVLADFDLDGDLDLALANGRIKRGEDAGELLPGLNPFWQRYAQRNQLLANDGTGQFQDLSESNPAFCGHRGMGRGLACGDLDNDGRPDLVVMHAGGPVQVLRNIAASGGHWLSVRAVDPMLGGRDAHGAEVAVKAGDRLWTRLVQPSYSYLVSNDPRAHFGLGSADRIDAIEVVWPDGTRERFPGGAVDRAVVLNQGSGVKP